MKRQLLLTFLVLAAIIARAEDFTVDGLAYTITSAEDKTVSVSKTDDTPEALVIPSSVTYENVTYTVTSVANYGFSGASITSVSIPNTVTSLGEWSFYKSSITSVTIPSTLTMIPYCGFQDCTQLANVRIEDSETVLDLGYGAFSGCTAAKTVYIGRNLTGDYCSSFMPATTSVEFGGNMSTINESLFNGITTLSSITIGNSITTIGNSAFYNSGTAEGITAQTVSMGTGVESIGQNAFYGCTNLTSVTLPEGLKTMGDYVFYESGLTSVTIPSTLTTIPYCGFQGCTRLANVRIENSETALELGNGAFSGCTAAKTVYIGRNLTGDYCSSFMPATTSVTFGGNMTTINDDLFNGITTLSVINIGNSITTIGNSAFYKTGTAEGISAQTLNMGTGVESIGDNAFNGCTNLTSVTLPEGLTTMGDYVFYESGLTSVTIPSTLTTIPWGGFQGCTRLANVRIEDSETALELGNSAFSGCTAEKEVYIGRNLKGDYCGSFMPATTSVTFGGNMTTINDDLFNGITTLSVINIGNSITTIGNSAFYKTGTAEGISAQTVNMGTGVTSIGQSAFDGCTNLTSVTLPEGLTTMGDYVFNQSGLTSVTIPSTLTTIPWGGFQGCTRLANVRIEDSETALELGNDAFSGCTAAKEVYIGRNLTNYCSNFMPATTSVEFGPQVTTINSSLFSSSTLTSVEVPWLTDPTSLPADAFNADTYSGATLWVPGGTKSIYEAADNWKSFTNIDFASYVVSITGSAHGTLSVGELSSTDGEAKTTRIDRETEVVFTTTPDNGYEVTTFTVNDKAQTLTEGTYTISSLLADQTVVAGFTAINYAITYNLAGGTVAVANPTTYNIETETFTLNNPTREGYTFAGWTGTDLDAATTEVTIAQGNSGERSYTATWTPITYNITYDLNDGTVETANPATYTIESEDITLNNPTKTGYTFAGWTGTDLEGTTTSVTIAQGSMGNRSYEATWTINQYTITFDTDGGTAVASITQDYGTTITPPADPTKTGHVFTGWTPAIPETMPAEDKTVKAGWTLATYSVSITGEGVTVDKPTPKYGESVTITIGQDEDRTLASLVVNDEDVTESVVDYQYTITNVTGNITIVATFNSTKEFITLGSSTTTFSCSQDLNFTGSDLKAYIAVGYSKSENKVLLVRVYDVPANTGLVIVGTKDETYKIPYSTSQSCFVNMLKGHLTTDAIANTEGEYYNYVLKLKDDAYVWQRNPDGTMSLAAQKAYLQLPSSFMSAAGAREVGIAFEDDETTDIKSFEMFGDQKGRDRVYNLNGQQIDTTRKGVVIVNGKKVVIR